MIASISDIDQKARESAEIEENTAAFLASGGNVSTVAFGVGREASETYRDHQSKLAKMNAAEKVAKAAGLIPKYVLRND